MEYMEIIWKRKALWRKANALYKKIKYEVRKRSFVERQECPLFFG